MRIIGWHGRPSSPARRDERGRLRWRGAARPRARLRPRGEPLEERALLAVAGTDYMLSGLRWQDPSHISYSIAPDGVYWDHGVNNLNAAFNGKFGSAWKRELARALATWQSVANLNISLVNDGFYKEDAIGQAQGDPRFGDIRFGGYAFANTTTVLAQTSNPPPSGWTAAGDVEINTAMNFQIGGDYDLYSVMLHETGHALGLEHVPNASQVMYANYHGVMPGLQAGDLAGIVAIYGPRQADGYRSSGRGGSLAQAIEVGQRANDSGAAVVTGVSLATIGDTEYFSFVAPAAAAGAAHVSACANGFSLLSPRVSVLDASGRLIATAADAASWSNNVTATLGSVVPGQRYYVAVSGATADVFATGAYALAVQFDGLGAPPADPTPDPEPDAPPDVPTDRYEPNDQANRAVRIGQTNLAIVGGLTLNTATDVDTFSFRNGRAGIVVATAFGTHVRVVDGSGRILAEANDQVGLLVGRARTLLYVQISSSTGDAVPSYALGVVCSSMPGRSKLRAAPSALAAADTPQAFPTPAHPRGWVLWNARSRPRR